MAGLTLENSGGDGAYISDGDDLVHDFASNITLLDLNSSFNYRQGLSVISVVGLNVSRCYFAHTGVGGGTPPMAASISSLAGTRAGTRSTVSLASRSPILPRCENVLSGPCYNRLLKSGHMVKTCSGQA